MSCTRSEQRPRRDDISHLVSSRPREINSKTIFTHERYTAGLRLAFSPRPNKHYDRRRDSTAAPDVRSWPRPRTRRGSSHRYHVVTRRRSDGGVRPTRRYAACAADGGDMGRGAIAGLRSDVIPFVTTDRPEKNQTRARGVRLAHPSVSKVRAPL